MHGARGDTERARETSTTPPSAARSARCAQARASLQTSTAAPEEWHRSGTLKRSRTPWWCTRERNDPIASPCHGMRGLPAHPIFASWPWLPHTGCSLEAIDMTVHERNYGGDTVGI